MILSEEPPLKGFELGLGAGLLHEPGIVFIDELSVVWPFYELPLMKTDFTCPSFHL